MDWLLLKSAHLFAPEDLGVGDLLVIDGRIAALGPNLPTPTGLGEGEVREVGGRLLLPGLIDGHIHVMGASGMGGPLTRSTDLQIERITGAGVTTVVSPLGADSLSRTLPNLLQRAAALEQEGLSAYCYTGGWRHPVPTVTGDPQGDVLMIDRFLGVKVAISEALAPLQGMDELCRLAHAAYTGGRLAGKVAVLHTHVGDHPDGLEPLREVIRRTGVPIDRIVATHVNRNPGLWRQAVAYAKEGGRIDCTGMQRPETGHSEAIRPSAAIQEALKLGVPPAHITLSTDSGAGYTRYDAGGHPVGLYMPGPDSLLDTMRELVRDGLSWGEASAFSTSHPADLLGLRKGRLRGGRDADLLLLSGDGAIDRVYGRGRLLVADGRPVVHGAFGGGAAGD